MRHTEPKRRKTNVNMLRAVALTLAILSQSIEVPVSAQTMRAAPVNRGFGQWSRTRVMGGRRITFHYAQQADGTIVRSSHGPVDPKAPAAVAPNLGNLAPAPPLEGPNAAPMPNPPEVAGADPVALPRFNDQQVQPQPPAQPVIRVQNYRLGIYTQPYNLPVNGMWQQAAKVTQRTADSTVWNDLFVSDYILQVGPYGVFDHSSLITAIHAEANKPTSQGQLKLRVYDSLEGRVVSVDVWAQPVN